MSGKWCCSASGSPKTFTNNLTSILSRVTREVLDSPRYYNNVYTYFDRGIHKLINWCKRFKNLGEKGPFP
jgi:hypothetical protein